MPQSQSGGWKVFPQIGNRPAGVLVNLKSSHAFSTRPTYKKLAHLPPEKLAREMSRPEIKAAILKEESNFDNYFSEYMGTQLDRIYVLGNPVDYEPGPEKSVANIAKAEGVDVEDKLYDLLTADNGKALLLFPLLNYSYGNSNATREMLLHPTGVFGLGDGGAHCGAICDASMTTWGLTHWARDRKKQKGSEGLPLEWVIKKQTKDTAELFGITDRGVITEGKKADINIIDFDELSLQPPELVSDLPAGGTRYIQKAKGYDYTLVNGVITREKDQDTGQRPGRLLRSGSR